jgi:hypothetical protein
MQSRNTALHDLGNGDRLADGATHGLDTDARCSFLRQQTNCIGNVVSRFPLLLDADFILLNFIILPSFLDELVLVHGFKSFRDSIVI